MLVIGGPPVRGGGMPQRIKTSSRSEPALRMIKLIEARAIMPYKWVHPDEER